MSNKNGEKLFELVDWFNSFTDQLNSLYNKISNVIKHDLKINEKRRYTNNSATYAHISSIFHMGFLHKGYSIDIFLNLFRIDNKEYKNIPALNCFKIEGGSGYYINAYQNLFSGENVSIKKENDFIMGVIKTEGKELEFKGFQVSLELFNDKDAEKVIRKEIIERLNKIS